MKNTRSSQRNDNKSINSNIKSHYSVNSNNINVDKIPYARSYPNMTNNTNNINNSKLSFTGLPPIPKTPYQDEKYRQAYDNCNKKKNIIQTLLNK